MSDLYVFWTHWFKQVKDDHLTLLAQTRCHTRNIDFTQMAFMSWPDVTLTIFVEILIDQMLWVGFWSEDMSLGQKMEPLIRESEWRNVKDKRSDFPVALSSIFRHVFPQLKLCSCMLDHRINCLWKDCFYFFFKLHFSLYFLFIDVPLPFHP